MATNKTNFGFGERGDTAIALAILLGLFAIAGAIYFRPVAGRYNSEAALDKSKVTGKTTEGCTPVTYRLQKTHCIEEKCSQYLLEEEGCLVEETGCLVPKP